MIIRNDATALDMAIAALEFYARQWDRLEAHRGRDGRHPQIVHLPSDDLFKDQGRIAKRALVSLNGWKIRKEGRRP